MESSCFLIVFVCFWPKGYQLGSLGKSHQNDDYLKQAMRKIVFPQESNLQPLDYRAKQWTEYFRAVDITEQFQSSGHFRAVDITHYRAVDR